MLFDKINKEIEEAVKEFDIIDVSLDAAYAYLYDELNNNPDKDHAIMNVHDGMGMPLFSLEVSEEIDDNGEVYVIFGVTTNEDYDDYNQHDTLIFDNGEDYFEYLKHGLKYSDDEFIIDLVKFRQLNIIIDSMLSDNNNLEEFSTNFIKIIKEKEGNISIFFTQEFKQRLKCK